MKWSLLFLLLHNVFFHLNIYNGSYGIRGNVSSLYTLGDFAKHAFRIIVGFKDSEQLLGGYWFLPQLFFASVFGLFAIRYVKNLYLALIAFLALTMLMSFLELRTPFWNIKALTMLSTAFFIAGYIYKKRLDNWSGLWLTALFAIVVAVGSVVCPTSMLRFTTPELLPYFIVAVCGIVMTLNISQYFALRDNWLKHLLLFVGDNTLTVLTWHFLCFKAVSLAVIAIQGLPIEMLACFPVIPADLSAQSYYTPWWPIYFIVGTAIPLSVKYFVRTFK